MPDRHDDHPLGAVISDAHEHHADDGYVSRSERRQAHAHHARRRRRKGRRSVVILVALLVVALGGYGAFVALKPLVTQFTASDDYSGQGIIARVSSPLDQGTAALAETVTPTAHASAAASSDAIWVWNNAKSGIGGYQSVGSTETYHVAVRFPSTGYKPTTGNWNWFIENHNDSGYTNWSCASAEKANISWDVETDGPDVQYQVGLNPRLKLRVMGGPSCSPSTKWYDFGPLQLDHWYDLRYQVKWTPTSAGFVNVYVDDKLVAAYVGPTLYQRPDGSTSYTNWDLVNYRWHASWNSTIFFDDAWLTAG